MATIIAKNQTGGALAVAELPIPDQEIPASGQVTLTDYAAVTEIQDSAEITAYITSGDVILNDGSNDLTQAESLNIASTYMQMSSVYVEYYGAVAYSVTTSASTLVLDTTRQSNSLFVLAGDQVTVQAGGGGDYLVRYDCTSDESGTGGQGMDVWLEIDGVEVTASRSKLEHYTTMTDNTGGRSMLLTLADAEVLRLRGQLTGGTGALDCMAGGINLVITTVGADGAAGPTGATGAGSSVIVQDGGATVSGGPHGTLNFIGLSCTDAGGGTADINQNAAVYVDYYDSGTTAVGSSATTLGLDTERQSNALFVLASDEVTVQATGAGDYLVTYAVTFGEADSSNRVTETWLELNGSEVPATRGEVIHWDEHGLTGDGTCGRSAILTLAASDTLRVRGEVTTGSSGYDTATGGVGLIIAAIGSNGPAGPAGPTGSGSNIIVEDEGSIVSGGPHSNLDFVGAGVTVTDAGSGVATITIPGGGSANISQYRRTTNQTITTTSAAITLDVTDFEDSNYTRSGANITINTAGVYKISYTVFFRTGGNFRRTVSAWVENNSTPIVPSVSADYARNNTDDECSAGATFMVELAASDVLTLVADSVGTNGSAIGEGDKMWICLEFLRAP